jgi:hypothetical protein
MTRKHDIGSEMTRMKGLLMGSKRLNERAAELYGDLADLAHDLAAQDGRLLDHVVELDEVERPVCRRTRTRNAT